jgi:protein SCO1
MHSKYLRLGLVLLLCCLGACKSRAPQVHQHGDHDIHADHVHKSHTEMGMTAPTDMSIYNVESTWHNQAAQPMKLSALAGKVQVVAMVYTSCQYACPRIISDMKSIEAALPSAAKGQVGFVLASIDPERDVPARLSQFSKNNGFDPTVWNLLTGDKSDVRELAALLGVQYKDIGGGDFSHSNVITILNKHGEVVHQQIGLGTGPSQSLAEITKLVR